MTSKTPERLVVRDRGMRMALADVQLVEPYLEEYDHYQLREVYLGYLDYLTEFQMSLFCDPALSANQMHEIRAGLARGLATHEVMGYADASVPWQTMRTVRLVLEGRIDPAELAAARSSLDEAPYDIAARRRASFEES